MNKRVTLVLWALVTGALMLPPLLRPLNYPGDDAFFYLEVAHNIVDGHGSTFNTITPTNGYHPLWLVVCTALSALGANSRSITLVLVVLTQQLMAIGMVLLFKRLMENLNLRFWWLALPVFGSFFFTGLYASEGHLNALCIVLSCTALLNVMFEEGAGLKRYILAGLSFGATVLARLDNAFLVGLFYCASLLVIVRTGNDGSRRRKLAQVLSVSCAAAIVVAPYLAHNYLVTGHLMPISGALKNSFPAIVPGFSTKLGPTGMMSGAFALVGFIISFLLSPGSRQRAVLGLFSAGVLVHAGYIVLFTGRATEWSWYYVSGIINVALTLIVTVNMIAARIERVHGENMLNVLRQGAVAVVAVLSLYAFARTWARFNNAEAVVGPTPWFSMGGATVTERWPNAVGIWLRDHLPSETRILVYDYPGAMAFTSGQRLLPVDGLISDFRYNDDLLREGSLGYLQRRQVFLWLGPAPTESIGLRGVYQVKRGATGYMVELFAPLYGISAGSFYVRDVDTIVDFKKEIPHPGIPDIALWRIASTDGLE